MAGKTVIKSECCSPALAALMPVLEWLAASNQLALVAIRVEVSFGATLAKQKDLFEHAIKGAPAEISSQFAIAWPLYEQEEVENTQ